ncbi:MAG: hypothetical protein COA33_011260 [Fluviicola sp.]|nr:hypothetical protein [Fluviicola sp.]
MRAIGKTIEISSIQFESNEADVLIKGKVQQGDLSYPTDVIVSQTQLNKVVNQLGRQNSHFDFNTHVIVEEMYNNEHLFTAEFGKTINSKLSLNDLLNIQTYVQIRA